MKLKHAIMTGMVGRISDRFHEYQPAKTFEERLNLAKSVEGANGIEVVYPSEFPNIDETIQLIRDSGLPVSAVNLNVKADKKWQYGSFTAPSASLREEAVRELKIALDLAAELGTNMVTCCPLIDGHNYNFQSDYLKQWGWLQEGIQAGASHRDDIQLSLEYKLNESRNFNILSDIGRVMYLCEILDMSHVGVTVDVGHALIAKETPAESLCLAAQADRLFYVHFNDNGREWDWDMLPGSVNFWDLLEVVFYLDKLGWDGWVSYDIITRSGDVQESMQAAISMVEMAVRLLERIGRDKLQGFIDEGIPARSFQEIVRSLL